MADKKLGPIQEAQLRAQIRKAESNALAQDPNKLKEWTGEDLNLDQQRKKDASTLRDLTTSMQDQIRQKAIAAGATDNVQMKKIEEQNILANTTQTKKKWWQLW